MTKGRTLALVIGLVYTALAVAGLIALQGAPPDARSPEDMFAGLGVSVLSTIFHAGLGLAGLAAVLARQKSAVRVYGVAVAIAALGLTAYGLPAAFEGHRSEVLNVGWFNVAIYAMTVLIGLFLAYGKPIRREAPIHTDVGET